MPTDRQLRLGLWLALALTANANRKHYGLATTWIPHLVGNSIGLAMPEIVRTLDALLEVAALNSTSLDGLRAAVREVTDDPPGWAATIAPVTLAYVVSHPQFNIYKGELGELRLLGFGLDAIPHSATAYSLTRLVYHGLAALAKHTPATATFAPWVEVLSDHPLTVSALILAGLTAFYELGEYRIHQQEYAATGGDESRMNMMWDAEDTIRDIMSNFAGWVAATATRPTPLVAPAPAMQ